MGPLELLLLTPLLVLAALLLLLVLLVARRRLLQRRGGTIECSLRLHSGRAGRGWALGVGLCTGKDFQWFRTFSLWPLPHRRYPRRLLEVVEQRRPDRQEAEELPVGATVLTCATGRGDGETVELGLTPEGLTAFLAWMESSPPDWTGPARRRRR